MKPIFVVGILVVIFLLANSIYKSYIDRIVIRFFPLFISFTAIMGIVESREQSYISSISPGFSIQLADFFICYMLFRSPAVKSKNKSDLVANLFLIITIVSGFFATSTAYWITGCLLIVKCIVVYTWYGSNKHGVLFKRGVLFSAEIAILIQSGISFLQKLKGGPLGLSILGEVISGFRERYVEGVIEIGVAGTFEHSSRLSIFILFCTLIVFFSEKERKKRSIFVVAGLVCMWLASSRTVIITLILGLVYYCWKNRKTLFTRKNVRYLVLIPLFAAIGLAILYTQGLLGIFLESDVSEQIIHRVTHWEIAWEWIRKNWILGYGINNFTSLMRTKSSSASVFMLTNPVHNVYLLYWLELGILGLISYIVLLVKSSFNIKNINEKAGIQKAAVIFIIVSIVYNFTGWAFSATPSIYLLWMAIGLANNTLSD